MVILVSTTEVVTYLHNNFMIRPQMRLAWPGISKYFLCLSVLYKETFTLSPRFGAAITVPFL